MPSLLLLTFLVQVLTHIVNTVGASTINEILWTLYNKLPTPTARDVSEAARLRREVVKRKRELASVSAQDEFSKWAKLRRQHDKLVTEHEAVSSKVKGTKSQFDTVVNVLRWAGTTGLRFLLQFWFSKAPLFWIPKGWVPYYAEWLLSFPRAPLGAVSMQVWWIACASFVALAFEAVGALVVLVSGAGAKGEREKPGDPIAMEAKPTEAAAAQQEKKEL